VRLVIALSTIPVAIVANGLRVAGTGIAAYHYGEEAAQGFFHEFSGWVVFVVSLAMVFVIHRTVLAVAPAPSKA
jgi:exosortase/archaeosortase family protein